jgi:hypothetical protein
MTWKDRTIITESVVILLLIAGCIGIWRFYYNPKLVYEWKGKTTETVYVTLPAGGYEYCYNSPITIDGKQNGKDFLITAGDECKKASRLLTVKTTIYHHVPIITYSPLYNIESKEFRHGITGMYFYNFGPVALGGGVSAMFSKSKLYDVGPVIGIAGFIK